MAFSHVPEETKSQINKAGRILVGGNSTSKSLMWARKLADRWRACHAYPINTFQATLRVRLKRSKFSNDPIVAQRLKRMPTIIDKLKRYPAMQLTTMQDIGGVRAVLGTVEDVFSLAREYRDSKRLVHELTQEKDYIQKPRDEDGYRSVHLIYKYRNKHAPEYDGLRLELQIRTKLQHTWATAVETMGTFLGQALKSRQGDQEWLDFFAVTSSAFAHKEKSPLVPRYMHLSPDETFLAVAAAEANLRALEKMDAFSAAVNEIVKHRGPGKSWFYHLIVLNSLEKTVDIKPYDRESFEQALADYSAIEAEAAEGKKIEPVLVSAGPIDKLRQAYPNFFLDIGEFVRIVNEILESAKKIGK
ncbi:MAG: RelA/SpoT domain-containing protein [Pseudomonadota bacterium]